MKNRANLQGMRSIASTVDRMIRDRKTIAIGIVTTLLVISISHSFHYVNAAERNSSSCQKRNSISIIDESGGNALFPKSNNNSTPPPFKNYVDTISKYVFEKVNEIDQSSSCRVEADLFFVYRPLRAGGIAPFKFKQTRAKNTKYLDSPWVKLVITNSPKLIVHAAFIWNERQFLFDQALLSGMKVSIDKPLLPFSENLYQKYGRDYEESVILAERNSSLPRQISVNLKRADQEKILHQRVERVAVAQIAIEKRLPADLLWGFRQGSQGGRGGTFPEDSVDKTIEHVFDKFIDINKLLLNGRFRSLKDEQHYPSVLNLKDIYNINIYRIESLN